MQETRLQLIEGTSSKFWHATQEGTTLTIRYGRIGTIGQTQEKTFGSEDEARSAFTKQVAEKVKKGYSESGDSSIAPITPVAPAPASAKSLSPVAETPTDFSPPRRIKLSEAERDRYMPVERPLPEPKPRPEPAPFDREACLQNLARIDFSKAWHQRKWDRLIVPETLTSEEAIFWILASQTIYTFHAASVDTVLEKIKNLPLPSELDLNVSRSAMSRFLTDLPLLGLRCALQLFGLPELIHQLNSAYESTCEANLMPIVENKILPALTADERSLLKELLQERRIDAPRNTWGIRLLARLGAPSEQLQSAVESWADGSAKPQYFGSYGNRIGNPQLKALVVLPDPDAVAREAHRLEALPMNGDDVKLLLATTELRCVDLVVQNVLSQSAKADAEPLVKALALAEAPEVAPHMLDLLLESKAPGIARQWLDENPAHAAEGLFQIAAGQGKKADAALAYLRGLKKRDLSKLIEAKLEGQPESIVRAIRERVLDREEIVADPLTESEAPEWVKTVFGGDLTVPDANADETPERRLNLTEADRPAAILPIPEPRPLPPASPFDIDACLASLLPQFNGKYWSLKPKLSLPMSKEEAQFWLEAAYQIYPTNWQNQIQPAALETNLRAWFLQPEADRASLTRYSARYFNTSPLLVPLWVLFGIDGIFLYIKRHNMTSDFARNLLPFLTPEQRAEIASRISEKIQKTRQHRQIGLLQLMDQLGLDAEAFETALDRLPDPGNYWYAIQLLPFIQRLKTPEVIVAAAEKLGAFPQTEAQGRKWLGATGWLGLGQLEKVFSYSYYDKSEAAKMMALVESPEVARYLAVLRKFPSAKVVARTWLDRFPAFAIEGLAPLLIEKDTKSVALSTEYLRELKRKGLGWLIEKKLPCFDEKIQTALTTRILDYDPRKEKAPSPRDTVLATQLPPVLVRTESGLRRLTNEQVAMLVADLRTTPLTEPSPSLELVRLNAEKLSLDEFAWALFEGWLSDGAPSKERWRMEALGHLGGDSVALKLTPRIRVWPGESQHQRAVLGLDCLRAIGTDTALMQINGIAQKISFKGIKERAKECLEAIAADRGFSRDELSDRIIPDGGLDERGSRTFDFGERQFTFLLSAELKPMVRDAAGKRLPDLPKPTTKDDPERAAAAVSEWKLLKKQVAEIAKTQAVRLEHAMVLGRRWTPEEFTQLFLGHPVMIHLVRRLIWGAYDAEGTLCETFRVCEDNTLADGSDALYKLPASVAAVGVVHPSHLTPSQQGSWGELLADYEILPPFVQLGRPTFSLSDEEKKLTYLNRYSSIKLDPKILVFGLDGMGWQRGAAQDGGSFACHHRVFGDITAVVTYEDGVWVGDNGDSWDPQEVTGIGFVREKRLAEDGWYSFGYSEAGIPLGEIDPVVVSEVLYDVTRLVAKAKKS